jgi:hypothetical protein
MTNQPTDNYFLSSPFSKESLSYVRLDLFTRRMQLKKDYDLFDNQAQMFARLAVYTKEAIEACNTESALVEAALTEVRKNKVSRK